MPKIFFALAVSILATVSAQLFLKKGVSGLGQLSFSFHGIFSFVLKILQSGWLMAGLFLLGISFFVWIFILSKFQLNMIYPIMVSLNYSFITVAAWFLFREYISPVQILGIVIIIFGTFLVLKLN